MKTMKAAALAGVLVLTATTAACGSDSGQAWFEDNCQAQTADVYKKVDPATGELSGDVTGKAMTQGAIHPPAGLTESTARIGLFSYDENSEKMVQEGELESSDLVCFEQSLGNQDREKKVDRADIEGELNQDEWTTQFTKVRSPDYPEGIWVAHDFGMSSYLGAGFDVDGDWGECAKEWAPATDITPFDAAGDGDKGIGDYYKHSSADC